MVIQKYRFISLFLILSLSTGQAIYAQGNGTFKLTSDADVTFQTIDGFGASDAWRAQFVGKNWPLDKRNLIADLLFSQEFDNQGNPVGIGLSLWRFYLSSGTAEQGDESDIGSSDNPWRRGECFLNEDGSYDWSKMEGQRWFLEAAKERGVEKLLAFPNAPPVYYSANGKGFAPAGVIHLNLKPGFMDDYATYMADVIEHFNDEGIFFDYLSPVNEPQWNWDGHSQEGTPALNEEIYALTRYLSRDLSSRGLRTRIVIGEAGNIGSASLDMRTLGQQSDGRDDQARFFFSKHSPFYIGDLPNVELTISAHSYFTVWPVEWQVRSRILADSMIREANPELGYWQSEYCILQRNDELGGGNGRDLGMKTALYVARIIHHDLVLANAKSWQWWTAITQVDYKDGLVYLDDGSGGESGRMGGNVESLQSDGAVRESKLLWVLGNYSRFIRPGMVRIKCELSEEQSPVNGILASAYKDQWNGSLVYVLVNQSEMQRMLNMGDGETVRTYTTDEHQNMGFASQPLNGVMLPARSVVTVVID